MTIGGVFPSGEMTASSSEVADGIRDLWGTSERERRNGDAPKAGCIRGGAPEGDLSGVRAAKVRGQRVANFYSSASGLVITDSSPTRSTTTRMQQSGARFTESELERETGSEMGGSLGTATLSGPFCPTPAGNLAAIFNLGG